MRFLLLYSSLLLLFASNVSAQLGPIHEQELNSTCEEIFLHSRTGIPLFKTQKSYVAVHPETFQKIWEINRQNIASLSEATSSESYSDYVELPATNIVYVGNSFVDIFTGKVLVDGAADGVKKIASYNLFPSKDILVVKTICKGAYRLYGFNAVKNTFLWKADIDEIGSLSLATLGDSDPMTATMNGLKPYINAVGDIVYVHEKYMMLIDHSSGKLKWSQPLEPGAILFSKSGDLIAVAEKRTGLGAAFVSSAPKFSKKLTVVDARTGEDAWKKEIKLDGNILFIQPYKDGFIVAHEEGFNIYDFNSPKAEPQWKKDFAAKEISDVVEEGNEIMVYYKDRRMLMDPVTGDEVWKKPEKLEEEVPVFTGGHTTTMGDYKVTFSGADVRIRNTKSKGSRYFPSNIIALDEAMSAVVGIQITRANLPPQTYYRFYYADLKLMKVNSSMIDLKNGLLGIHVSPKGYFVYGPQSYVFVKIEAGKPVVAFEQKYPDPAALERGLANLVMSAATISYFAGVGGASAAYIVGDGAAFASYQTRLAASEMAGNAAYDLKPRRAMARIDENNAFFFSRNDDGNLALFQVDKNDGEEKAHYKFDDKTPVYEIDYVTGQMYYVNGKTVKIFKLKSSS